MKRKKRDIFLFMLINPLFIVIYGVAAYYFAQLCQYGGVRQKAPILLLCAIFFVGWLVWFIIRIILNVHKESSNEEVKKSTGVKIWITISLLVLIFITGFFGYKVYYSSVKYNGKLSWYLDDLHRKREVELTHNNIYKDGVKGILKDINKKTKLPKEMYLAENFDVRFKEDGTITYISTFIYGKDDKGKLKTILVDYDKKKSDKITIYLNGEANADYNGDKVLTPLLETSYLIPIKDVINYWDADEFGLMYSGKKDLGYDITGVRYVDSKGNVRSATNALSDINGYFVSIYAPGKEDSINPDRYKLVSDISNIEGEDYKGLEQSTNEDDNVTENKTGEYTTLSDGSVVFSFSKKTKYKLAVTDAACGSRAYALVKSEDGGNSWSVVNDDPFGHLGGANGISFIDENLGFIGLSTSGGASGELYRTTDGGKNFTLVSFPDVEVPLTDTEKYNPFDTPGMPYCKDGALYVKVGQGSDGDYNGGASALFKSTDDGVSWEYVK